MASDSRFYQLELRHRPALWGDVGSLLKIEGLLVGGEGARTILLLPSADFDPGKSWNIHQPSIEDWSDWLQRSDNPEILVNGSLEKAFHRKVRYEISGAVQQKVWVADGCKCMYCGRPMGAVQLTIDHFWPLEMGGKNDPSNYLSACRKCNKDKGGMDPQEWCNILKHPPTKLTFSDYVHYLATRKLP
ncbi:MAG TPA: HNH endonuclease [Candidatus Acidoferrales bacterium]|nr:HNH endonuclease [Candidatus Acidoferrales bacterium]